jgi:hypothetical protein
MAEPTSFEQYLLEKINAARAEHGIAPLAPNLELGAAGDSHSDWMLKTGTFSHTGVNGTDPGQREAAAGYDLSGNSASGENIAYTTTSSPAGLQDEVDRLHTNLMNSPGHYANLMNPNFKEAGFGLQEGNYGGRDSAMLTEDFGGHGTGNFVTGVAYNDANHDGAYDPGEGLGGLTVTATGATGTFTTTTMAAGGYDLQIPTGSYDVTFSGAGAAGTNPQHLTVVDHNVKVDFTSGGTAAEASPAATTSAQPEAPAVTVPSSETATNANLPPLAAPDTAAVTDGGSSGDQSTAITPPGTAGVDWASARLPNPSIVLGNRANELDLSNLLARHEGQLNASLAAGQDTLAALQSIAQSWLRNGEDLRQAHDHVLEHLPHTFQHASQELVHAYHELFQ